MSIFLTLIFNNLVTLLKILSCKKAPILIPDFFLTNFCKISSTFFNLKKFNNKSNSGDFDKAAEDLRLASRSLGRITGKFDVEEILDSIFNDFCIGK